MKGGELFVPKIPSMKVTDLAVAIAPDVEIKIIGIRPGEKLHEIMISADDARNTLEFNDYFVIQPAMPWWDHIEYKELSGGRHVPEDFVYSSEINDQWLTIEEIQEIIADVR
jgi:UDP-N-acetylglucosamine 4,6-dehydratase